LLRLNATRLRILSPSRDGVNSLLRKAKEPCCDPAISRWPARL
jgi:hypothetical protein